MKHLFALSAVAFAGCAHEPRETVIIRDPAAFPPSVSFAQPDLGTIRHEPSYKAYPAGRYVDPHDPTVMHEGHVVYVQETGPTWNLQPHVPVPVPLGPGFAPNDPARSQAPSPDEWRAEFNEQRRATRAVQEQAARLQQTTGILTGAVVMTQQLAEHTLALGQQQAATEQRLRLLEEALRSSPVPSITTNAPASNLPPARMPQAPAQPDSW